MLDVARQYTSYIDIRFLCVLSERIQFEEHKICERIARGI